MQALLHQIETTKLILGVGRTTIYDLAAKGHLEVVHIGRRALITDESLRAYVESLRSSAGAA